MLLGLNLFFMHYERGVRMGVYYIYGVVVKTLYGRFQILETPIFYVQGVTLRCVNQTWTEPTIVVTIEKGLIRVATPCNLIILSSSKSHFASTNIEHSEHILQKHVPQHCKPSPGFLHSAQASSSQFSF